MKIRDKILAMAIGVNGLVATGAAGAVDEVKASEKAAAVGLLPHQKRGLEVEANERNPFAHRVVGEIKTTEKGDTNSEEAKIRSVLNGLKVTGITTGSKGLKVMAGGLILEINRPVPQLIANQTDRLKVTKVSAKSVELTWIDEEGAEEPRKHSIDLDDLKPWIGTILPGSDSEGSRMHRIDPAGQSGSARPAALAERSSTPTPADQGD